MLRSFRFRLIIAFVALFAAISVAVSFVGLMLREQQIRNVFDRELRLRADILTDSLAKLPELNDSNLRKAVDDLSHQIYFRDFYVQVYNAQSEPVAASENLGTGRIKLAKPFSDVSADGVIREREVTPGTFLKNGPAELRGLRLRLTNAQKQEYLAVIATDPRLINDSVNALRWLFLGGNFGGVIAAAGAAWLVTGAMARRIDAIKAQVQTLGPDELSRRIETRDTDEISELAVHLNAMLDRLKAGFETQERFIHDASHELKTPVATVQAEAQALMLGDPEREELMDFVRSTNDEMRRLGRLTEALLLLTRNSEARVAHRFRTMDMTEITIAAIRHLSTLATDHKVRLNLVQPEGAGESLLIRCDPDLLEAMISNLIRNAIRFSPQKSEIRITLQTHDGLAELNVEDAGPGIPADILPQIFDRYFQTSQTRVRRGAGLGLAIALTVVNLHGGSISASNRPGHGACFTVRLPLLSATPAKVATA
ncbi:MAG TPA: HAMP domain-containing sensor histidine kinase [Tepidisphaeraceae bacterium]|jgi:signal transduction histidine kinase